jgi:regulator of sigma E protease
MEAELEKGDRILEIEGQTIHTWSQMTEIVRNRPGQPLHLKVQRKDQIVSVTVTPASEEILSEEGHTQIVGKIGIILSGRSVMSASSILTAPVEGLVATWKWAELTLVGVYKLLVGELSTKNLGGPLMIASVSGEHAEEGISNLIFLIAVLSMNLGILNLLPIPILDGGHLFFFICEAILGRPLGERSREIAQQVGLVLLFSIMIYATWNDITRLLQ